MQEGAVLESFAHYSQLLVFTAPLWHMAYVICLMLEH